MSNSPFRSTTVVGCVFSSLLFGAACGGRSEHTPDSMESSDAETSNSGSDAPSNTPSNTTSNTTGDSEFDDGLALGECFEGWQTFEGECPWLGSDNLCYATKADACACLCPRDKASTCVSGLPGGPDAQTRVSCF